MMEEEKKKEILWWQHFFNFLFNVGIGYILIILVVSYGWVIYLVIEGLIFVQYSKHNRKQDILMQIVSMLAGLIVGFSLCIY